MVQWEYIKFHKSELMDITFINIVLSLLFTITFQRFSDSSSSFLGVIIPFLIFLYILFFSRLYVMKLVGYFNAFELIQHQTYFDRFWLNKWDKVSYYEKKYEKRLLGKKKSSFKGIPSSILSIIIYILTLGFIIFPSLWRFKYKKIPHLHLGTQQKFEYEMPHLLNIDISDYRFSKSLFAGFTFYFIFGLLMKPILYGSELYYWFFFILNWIAFITIIPIIGTEGYELFMRNKFAWISALTILILGMLSLLIFEDFNYVIWTTIFTVSLVIFVQFYKKVLNE